MIRLIMIRFWPAFIPLIVYVLWLTLRRRKARQTGDVVPGWRDGPLIWAILASLALVMLGFFSFGLSLEHNEGSGYEPKRFEGGQMVPGQLQ